MSVGFAFVTVDLAIAPTISFMFPVKRVFTKRGHLDPNPTDMMFHCIIDAAAVKCNKYLW